MLIKAGKILERVRQRQPVVHHLTNWVTINDCALVVKALGASPVMAHAPEEVAEMTGLAGALVLNIGTLTVDLVEAMKLAAAAAHQKGIPVILDACGAGATRLRDTKALELLNTGHINLVKGNSSEVSRLAGGQARTKGVDAGEIRQDMRAKAKALAQGRKVTVVVTGKEDIVSDGARTWLVNNGHPMMTALVGTGCMAASAIGAFAAVEPDLVTAAVAGLACYEIAAELAAASARGPGSFKQCLFDELYQLTPAQADARALVARMA